MPRDSNLESRIGRQAPSAPAAPAEAKPLRSQGCEPTGGKPLPTNSNRSSTLDETSGQPKANQSHYCKPDLTSQALLAKEGAT